MKKIRNVFKRIKNKKQSFTLIEMAIVLFIISLLMLLICRI